VTRRITLARAFEGLDEPTDFVAVVEPSAYAGYALAAQARLARRDPDDWPVLALALAAKCSIWTEDRDFFGTGVATWNTDLVDIGLRALAEEASPPSIPTPPTER
jgi:predicted nucleic acid-binding protein